MSLCLPLLPVKLTINFLNCLRFFWQLGGVAGSGMLDGLGAQVQIVRFKLNQLEREWQFYTYRGAVTVTTIQNTNNGMEFLLLN